MWLYFIGLTLKHPLTADQIKELAGNSVTVQGLNVYYKDRACRSATSFTENMLNSVSLTDYEFQHFVNQLKRVRSSEIYATYNDDFGFHQEKVHVPDERLPRITVGFKSNLLRH